MPHFGRMDHILGSFHALAHLASSFPTTMAVVITGYFSFFAVLPEGRHEISMDSAVSNGHGHDKDYIGIVPISMSETVVSTNGLCWDLGTFIIY